MNDTSTIPLRIDAKGKYYTKVVSTQTLEVIMRLGTGEVVRGSVHVRPEHRLSDMMNDGQPFLSLTGATVTLNGEEMYRTAYIAINRREVQWVTPVQAMGTEMDDERDDDSE